MQVWYNLPGGTLEFIDWEAQCQSTQAHSHQGTHFVKLCHDLLPTGHIVCTYETSLPDYCPICKSPQQDFHHVLKCHHPSRVKWKETLLSSFLLKRVVLRPENITSAGGVPDHSG
jgi:hypothetical protein